MEAHSISLFSVKSAASYAAADSAALKLVLSPVPLSRKEQRIRTASLARLQTVRAYLRDYKYVVSSVAK